MRRSFGAVLVLAVGLGVPPKGAAQLSGVENGEWRYLGGDAGHTRSNPGLTQIDALVGRLWVPAAVQESTLKVTAPVPQSPTNAEIVDSATPTLTSTTAAGRFVSGTFEHHFEVSEIAVDGTTTLVETGTVAPTTASMTYTVRTALVNGGTLRISPYCPPYSGLT